MELRLNNWFVYFFYHDAASTFFEAIKISSESIEYIVRHTLHININIRYEKQIDIHET